MHLDRVTITGADDSIDPRQLLEVSRVYPSVEWGILLSRANHGGARFPSWRWLQDLFRLEMVHRLLLRLSAHVCGEWVRDALVGGRLFWVERSEFLPMFQRMQWNFHAALDPCHEQAAAQALAQYSQHGRCQMIFQMDGVNDKRLMKLRGYGLDLVPLFDQSGGAGIVPLEWPRPLEGMYCGYAGGLGPDTLERQLPRLALAVGDRTIWIDMERRVRSDDDQRFDLDKVEACLKLAEPYIWMTNKTMAQHEEKGLTHGQQTQ